MQHLGRIGWTQINVKSGRVNHKDSYSVIMGFDALCKYYSKKNVLMGTTLSIPSVFFEEV